MPDWNSLLNGLNAECLGAFGREVFYIPQFGKQFSVRAVFEATRGPEDAAPGIYAALFVRAGDFLVPPERGDEVIVDGTTYKLFDMEADQGSGVFLRLRQQT